ncbi:hypothetical protein FISHEDRAFT_74630 [Fistulina hepatica ATCC 64428]|uniref:Uncharacterized protein n=1 Tax=Fistulina hepatica ATCC 64428 TaxID=1128425 RepID=A0A0D7AA19_9AGAR|nr:hypothetical protein FISHEDRAFT_74630 [Fistulina hepatica ATCC 64428]
MSNTIGTESSPLETTGEHEPMGVSSIEGGKVEVVSDTHGQRAGIFGHERSQKAAFEKRKAKPQPLGESMAHKFEEKH